MIKMKTSYDKNNTESRVSSAQSMIITDKQRRVFILCYLTFIKFSEI